MKMKKEFITAIQLLIQIHLLYWTFTWNIPPDFDGNRKNEKVSSIGKISKAGSNVPLELNKHAILLETVKNVRQVRKTKMVSCFGNTMIPSFNEWKESEIIKEEKSNNSTRKVHERKTSRRKLNYASSKCGAKILSSNSEARHRVSILNEKADEYMLNPCKAKQWFVIELCDTIEITQIALANYELYSSSPKAFSVFWSDIYPTHSWRLLGTYVAGDQRSMETFEVTPRNLGKFIKIVVSSHYGKEHYCTLSTVRVLGYSMIYGFEEAERVDTKNKGTEFRINSTVEKFNSEENASLIRNKTSALFHKSATTEASDRKSQSSYVPIKHFVKENVNKTCKCNRYSSFYEIALRKSSSDNSTCIFVRTKKKTMNSYIHNNGKISYMKNTSVCLRNKISLKDIFSNVCPIRKEQEQNYFHLNQYHSKIKNNLTIDSENFTWSTLPVNETVQEDGLEKKSQSVYRKDIKALKYEEFKRNYARAEQIPTDTSCPCENKVPSNVEAEWAEKSSRHQQTTVDYESSEDSAALIQKESILVKLASRIGSSEFNLSLINKYLQQLSQSYIQQMEDMHTLFNGTVKAITTASDKAVVLDNHQQKEIEHLEHKMRILHNKVEHLLVEQSHMVGQVIELHAFFLILEFIIISTIFTIFMNKCKQSASFHDSKILRTRKYSNKYSFYV